MQYNDFLTKEEAVEFRSGSKYWLVNGKTSRPIEREGIMFDLYSREYFVDNETPEDGVMLFDDENEAWMWTEFNHLRELESAIVDFKKNVNPDSWKMYIDEAFEESYGQYLVKDVPGGDEAKEKLYRLFVETHGIAILEKKRREIRYQIIQYSEKSGALLPCFDIDWVMKDCDPLPDSDWSRIGGLDCFDLHASVTCSTRKDELLVGIQKRGGYLIKSCLFKKDARQSILDWIRQTYRKLCGEYRRMTELGFHLVLEHTYILQLRKVEYGSGESSPRLKEIEIYPAGDRVHVDVRVPGAPGVMKTLRSEEVIGDLVDEAEKTLIEESFDESYPLPVEIQKVVNGLADKYPGLFVNCVDRKALDMEIADLRKKLSSLVELDVIDEEKAVSLVKELAKTLKEKKELK